MISVHPADIPDLLLTAFPVKDVKKYVATNTTLDLPLQTAKTKLAVFYVIKQSVIFLEVKCDISGSDIYFIII